MMEGKIIITEAEVKELILEWFATRVKGDVHIEDIHSKDTYSGLDIEIIFSDIDLEGREEQDE